MTDDDKTPAQPDDAVPIHTPQVPAPAPAPAPAAPAPAQPGAALPIPVKPGFLLVGLFAVLGVITAILFGANYVPALASYVDANFFQLILSLLVSFVIGVFVFGFTAGATASMQISTGTKSAISFGGAMAAVAGLFLIILPNLTPTTRLTVYLREAHAGASHKEFKINEGLDVVLQLEQGRIVKTIIDEAQFGLLPKGVDIPITVAGMNWAVAGLDPETCAVPAPQPTVKAGCRVVWLRMAPTGAQGPADLRDLPPTGVGFSQGENVQLRRVIDALADELQRAATKRDANSVVARPDWTGLAVADRTFRWKEMPDGAKACAFVRLVEQAFNDANPDKQVFVLLQKNAVEVRGRTTEPRPNDTCS
jgi:hypothetical protein